MRGEFIDVGGHRLYYYAAGTRGAGDPIVLLHGFPTSGHVWANVTSLLPAGRRIVVPDLLGHGRSDHPVFADLTIEGHATNIAGLMDVLGIQRAAIVGHHLGALVGATVAAHHPGRVSHLGLLNPIGGDATLTGTFAVLRAFFPLSRLVPAGVTRTWVRRELLRWYHDPARGRLSVDQYVRALAMPGRWTSFLQQLRALDGAEAMQRTRALDGIDLPVALLVGSNDPAVPQDAIDALRGVLPHATLDIVRDGHHFSPEESPEQVARLITRLVCG